MGYLVYEAAGCSTAIRRPTPRRAVPADRAAGGRPGGRVRPLAAAADPGGARPRRGLRRGGGRARGARRAGRRRPRRRRSRRRARRRGAERRRAANMADERYREIVARFKEHILAGDIFQGVPSRRVSFPAPEGGFPIYRRLRVSNPAPYMFFVRMLGMELAGSSPEPLVRVEGRRVSSRPIAGTRPRGQTEVRDRLLEHELLADPKEQAEHAMLVDLARNDLGRVCVAGSVAPDRADGGRAVHQGDAHRLAPSRASSREDLHPAGRPRRHVPGRHRDRRAEAPSDGADRRARARPPEVRTPAPSATSTFAGDLDFCITIRTAVVTGGRAHVQTGRGRRRRLRPARPSCTRRRRRRRHCSLAPSRPPRKEPARMILVVDHYDCSPTTSCSLSARHDHRGREVRRRAGRRAGRACAVGGDPVARAGPARGRRLLHRAAGAAAARDAVLGVCLGHQAHRRGVRRRGGRATRRAREGLAGVPRGHGILAGVSNPFDAGRYHSLVVGATTCRPSSSSPHGPTTASSWRPSTGSSRGSACSSTPEILTPEGPTIVENFLTLTG